MKTVKFKGEIYGIERISKRRVRVYMTDSWVTAKTDEVGGWFTDRDLPKRKARWLCKEMGLERQIDL